MKRSGKRWLFWVGLIISGVFLVLAFRKIDYTALWTTLRETHWWWLVPGLVMYYIGVLMRTWRWQFLVRPLKKVSIRTLFPIINIGYMGNNVFPLRMGEVLRAVVLKRREDASISGTLATIVVERIFDAVVVVGFVLLNLSQLSGEGPLAQVGGLAPWAVGIFLLGLIVFIMVALFPQTSTAHLLWDHQRRSAEKLAKTRNQDCRPIFGWFDEPAFRKVRLDDLPDFHRDLAS